MDELFIGSMLASVLRVSVPLLLCAMAGVLSERSGVVDLGLEGKMLFAAFAAAAAAAVTQSTAWGCSPRLAWPALSRCCTASPPSRIAAIKSSRVWPST